MAEKKPLLYSQTKATCRLESNLKPHTKHSKDSVVLARCFFSFEPANRKTIGDNHAVSHSIPSTYIKVFCLGYILCAIWTLNNPFKFGFKEL